eukprot:203974-Prymnesium_polylepis.1
MRETTRSRELVTSSGRSRGERVGQRARGFHRRLAQVHPYVTPNGTTAPILHDVRSPRPTHHQLQSAEVEADHARDDESD